MSKRDHAAAAANDDTHVNPETPTLGEHVEKAQAASDATAAAAAKKAKGKKTKDVPELKVDTIDSLHHQVAVLTTQLAYFHERREREQNLLANRDAALHAIEGAKSRLSSEKADLAAIEEQIAAMLKQPVPTNWEDTPIGRVIAGEKTPPPVTPWKALLPSVSEDRVRLLDDEADEGEELPTIAALCGAVLDPKAMEGEKRTVAQTVSVYGKENIVTHLWKDAETGACRANVVALITREEWATKWEGKYGRAVKDFDQTKESRTQRQHGGLFCGLTVKAGKRALIVGPQETALHLGYVPPEQKGPEEVELPQEKSSTVLSSIGKLAEQVANATELNKQTVGAKKSKKAKADK